MDPHKPEYFRPALIAGAAAGVFSAIPGFSLLNCVCCLWIMGGAAVAVKLLAQASPVSLKPADGALAGALTGIVAAVAHTLISMAFPPDIEMARRVLGWLSGLGIEQPPNIDSLLEGSTRLMSPGLVILGLFVTAAVFAVFGALGGVIGVSLFGRKALPPAAPPAAPRGPADAS
ncbi:MAG TPA: hypothetical protein PLP83_10325 [Candidatus Aminicenantes bacterium]|nr:hypothetical protein [Candidatus Aminicenantes bacterium]